MSNPFEVIEARLSTIENLLLDIKHKPQVDSVIQKDRLLTVREAADFLNLAVPTVYGMVSRNEVPFMKRSKRLYFSREDLLNYIKEGRRQTLSERKEAVYDSLAKRKGGRK